MSRLLGWALGWIVSAMLASGAAAGVDGGTAAPRADKPFGWLIGRWSRTSDYPFSLSWAEPDGGVASWKRRVAERDLPRRVDLIITEDGDALNGALDAVTSDGKSKHVVTFRIDRGRPDRLLTWNEGGARYQSPLEDVERGDQRRYLRFSKMHSRSHRRPYPIVVELSISNDELILRRAHGPQHGAAVSQIFSFPMNPR